MEYFSSLFSRCDRIFAVGLNVPPYIMRDSMLVEQLEWKAIEKIIVIAIVLYKNNVGKFTKEHMI